jgi:hypothetical protein
MCRYLDLFLEDKPDSDNKQVRYGCLLYVPCVYCTVEVTDPCA